MRNPIADPRHIPAECVEVRKKSITPETRGVDLCILKFIPFRRTAHVVKIEGENIAVVPAGVQDQRVDIGVLRDIGDVQNLHAHREHSFKAGPSEVSKWSNRSKRLRLPAIDRSASRLGRIWP